MTWPTPPPSSSPHRSATSATTPTAPLGALTLGDLFSATLATYRRKLWLFLMLALVPYLLMVVVFLVVMAAILLNAWNTMSEPEQALTALGIVAVAFVPLYALSIYTMVLSGRMSVAAIDLATGRGEPTWANLRERTRGLGVRVLLLNLGVLALTLGVAMLVSGFVVFALLGSRDSASLSYTTSTLVGLGMIALFVLLPLVYALAVKVLYTVVVMAEEGLGPLAAIGRSWRLTDGAYWRTVGYYLVAALAVMAVGTLAQVVLLPLSAIPVRGSNDLALGVIVSLVSGLVVLALHAVVAPFSAIWYALMYLGRRREQAGQPVLPAWMRQPSPQPPWQA